jgi:UDP-2-acetamido-3-amino-2,3-dideoxy-glucuronate N-acetyltransferase
VVTRDVAAYALVMGNPARRTAWMCRCGEKLGQTQPGATIACAHCGARYEVGSDRIAPVA